MAYPQPAMRYGPQSRESSLEEYIREHMIAHLSTRVSSPKLADTPVPGLNISPRELLDLLRENSLRGNQALSLLIAQAIDHIERSRLV